MKSIATLHIEHPISDLDTWFRAFARFEEARQKAGVRAQRVCQPVDDDRYIYVTLDFDTVREAEAFKRFLERECGPPRTPPRPLPDLRGPGFSPT